ncbi:FAD-dependent monooxygenase [Nocardiopsis sp. JB363]|uniref:FAD-dependent monooxygenase n=1 Tax=Nocardiopsis sp. JB363 TaxID=1434837 RepID=UPI00097A12F9|nr:FAD-dependent monooxygenase [Nocardiopsis sp. JB363]SIO86584.1 Salicylate hydroxylase [Nocardiopsis sp. JB363]
MYDTEVLVVGAGPTGLTTACALMLQGVSVRVIDTAESPSWSSRANFLHARGAEVLDRLGALGNLPEQAISALTIKVHVAGEPVSVVRFGDVGLRTSRPALLTPQSEVERVLRERLADLGGSVRWGTRLVGIRQDPDGVVASVEDGDPIRACWLVGADGAHSATRKLVGEAFPGAPIADTWLLADVHMDWSLEPDGSYGWLHRDGVLGALPMRDPAGEGVLWRLMAYVPGLGEQRPDEGEILERLRTLLPERTHIDQARVLDATWTSVFRIHRRLADSYRRGRVLLAGDAAHIHSPMGGQGMLTGIGDAENLAWKLALVLRGIAESALVDTYQAERRPLAEVVLRTTTANSRLQLGEGRVLRYLREHVLLKVIDLPAVQRWATSIASQLSVSYRKGPLGGRRPSSPSKRPGPGDRVPDLPCLGEDGEPTRLHGELGSHWVLLAPTREPGGADIVRERLGNDVTVLTPRSSGLRDLLLVRPDGHLLWRGRPGDDRIGRVLDGLLNEGRTR